ncbi:AraC family transcriptional regulator [Granulicella paludicola]|uniref:AraC family transcriptional regulator n=1 Tax=Granulicella paludicola TaxID=474951 RepID=UPI0021DF8857|nr:AraC family transcriptional regulator [Granulicella paludicola]
MGAAKSRRARSLDDLAQALRRYTDSCATTNPYPTAIEGFLILRSDQPKLPTYRLFQPALCIAIQGSKWATFGDFRYEYKAGQAMVVTVEMPSRGAVSEANPGEPFLGFVLVLDLAVLRELAEQMSSQPKSQTQASSASPAGVCVVDLSAEGLDCLCRAMRMLETPAAIPLLYPGLYRELLYWLLTGSGGGQLLHTVVASSRENRLIAAIHELKTRFAEPVRVDELAAIACMSSATFHRHFKATTGMSPLQYQKELRLLAARRLMLENASNVETVATEVGYESAPQFTREYARMFGRPPRRDVRALTDFVAESF